MSLHIARRRCFRHRFESGRIATIVGTALAFSTFALHAGTFTANDYASLVEAIDGANAMDSRATPHTITLTSDIALSGPLPLILCNATIDGQGHTLDGGGLYRLLFVGVDTSTQGDLATTAPDSALAQRLAVHVSNIVLKNGNATGGGSLGDGGGGMGAGGAVFVNGSADVFLKNVQFENNEANGGFGGPGRSGGGGGLGGLGGSAGGGGIFGLARAGGGGVSGDGGFAWNDGTGVRCGGGGGYTGDGGDSDPPQPGTVSIFGISGSAGSGGNNGDAGAANGGGGGGGGLAGGGGGGGFGGIDGADGTPGDPSTIVGGDGGDGGFGGGGGCGGAGYDVFHAGLGGRGGFGGGGGAGGERDTPSDKGIGGFGGGGGYHAIGGFGGGGGGYGGNGGFGGGGGNQNDLLQPPGGLGGFGGGDGGGPEPLSGGGGGAAMGGALFVVDGGNVTISGSGDLTGSSVLGGPGGGAQDPPFPTDGRPFGSGVFLQGSNGDLRFDLADGETYVLTDEITDERGSDPSASSNARGLTLAGSGTLMLQGDHTFTGATNILGGILALEGNLGSPVSLFSGEFVGVGTIASISAPFGSIAPGDTSDPFGTLSVTNDVTFLLGSRLRIAADPLSTTSARLDIGGNASLDGIAEVDFGGSAPSVGAVYRLLTAAAVTGTFKGLALPESVVGSLIYSDGAVDLEITAPPDEIFRDGFDGTPRTLVDSDVARLK